MLPGGIRALLTLSLVTLVTLTTLPTHGSAPAERPRPGAAAEIALDHLRAHHERYGVGAADVADLRVQDALVSPHTGVTHVYIRQRHQGLDVLGGDATVNVGPDGPVIHVGSRLVPGLASASGTARLDAPAAVRAAASALGLRPDASLRVARGPAPGGERATVLTRGGISLSPIPVRLAYQPSPQGIRLAWNLEIEEISEEHWWNVSVDASTGAVLAEIDYVAHDRGDEIAAATGRVTGRRLAPLAAGSGRGNDGARYRVFALPLESPNDGDRTLVTSPADALASPFGWHDTNGAAGPEFTTTQGNNVHAYLDTTNTATTGVVPPGLDAEGGPTLTFDFPWNPDLPPTATKDAAVTNLFYWNNVIHDVFYRYGFTEAAGNFQVNNYGRGGTGNDSVRAEAQDGSGTNNANFATPADGSRPRMQMYVWTTGLQSQRRIIDGDMDAGVIIHEYGHGISNRLTGGRNNVGCLNNQEQMGEGWSDWLAIALTALPTETGAQRRGMGTYVLAQPNRQGSGIRPTPYSTNMSINGATYDTIKTAAVPHGVGYVWSTMLWEVFWDLVDEHGFNPNVYEDWTTGGNNLAIQLVMDGMKMQPCSPGFVDGRNAILAADVALTGGENQCLIWRGFAKRGLGYSARQGSSGSRSDGVQAFDLHPDCQAQAGVSPTSIAATVSEGGTTTETLRIANLAQRGGQTLGWSIAEAPSSCAAPADVAWLAVSPSSGDTAPGRSTEVDVRLAAGGAPAGSRSTGRICVLSNDAGSSSIAIPVSLEVTG